MRPAYYNEHDRFAAQWLRELIGAGLIAAGDVDERSIVDVRGSDLAGYGQCHFFAGIGVWSYALRCAGWPDYREIWTGSCPCQPFSAAGERAGFADERHLWPAFYRLVGERRPAVVLGEQVASKDGLRWLALVQADLEGAGYAVGAADLCAAGIGAPHIRQRLWWVAQRLANADSRLGQQPARRRPGPVQAPGGRPYGEPAGRGDAGGLADAGPDGPQGRLPGRADQERAIEHRPPRRDGADRRLDHAAGARHGGALVGPEGDTRDEARLRLPGAGRAAGWLADAAGQRQYRVETTRLHGRRHGEGGDAGAAAPGDADGPRRHDIAGRGTTGWPGPPDQFWDAADWLLCRDGKWRPVEPGTFPLADGAPARVGRLRGYGNALAAPLAQVFIEEVMAVL